jgi:hypothetical protein
MKLLNTVLIISLLAGASSAMAATEISFKEASGMRVVDTITVTEDTVNSCMDKISKAADKAGAEYFVITGIHPAGNGSRAVLTGKFFNK